MKKLVSLFVVVSCLFVEGMSQTVCSFQREDNRVVLRRITTLSVIAQYIKSEVRKAVCGNGNA